MALFSWKKAGGGSDEAPTGPENASAVSVEGFQSQPEKARKWFDHARTYADTTNYDGALLCYANGIKLDPEAMSAHQAMYDAAIKYLNQGGKPASGKDIKGLEDGTAVGKFAAAEFAWMKEITNGQLALKMIEAAIKANQHEVGNWAAPKALGALSSRGKKLSKGALVQAKDLFKEVRAWNEAIAALQRAREIDPTDNAIDHELKDLSAQRAMDAGGYEKAAGQEGGFRTFVKDADKQRQLIEQEAIAGNQSMEERNLQRAKAEYEKNPKVPDIINQYAQLVKKKGTPEAEKLAYNIYMKGYQETGEYRFRMAAGDIQLDPLRREYEALQAKADENPSDATLKAQAEAARRRLNEAEEPEYQDRVKKYPTDRHLKLRLGEIEFGLGKFADAMEQLQAARDEPKLRVRAGHMLGRCFAAESWHMEAISEYKEALASIDATERDRELSVRYDLMVSLIEHARFERDPGLAKEALEICSTIARKNITYRDIRTKRKEVDQLIRDLTGGAPPAESVAT